MSSGFGLVAKFVLKPGHEEAFDQLSATSSRPHTANGAIGFLCLRYADRNTTAVRTRIGRGPARCLFEESPGTSMLAPARAGSLGRSRQGGQ